MIDLLTPSDLLAVTADGLDDSALDRLPFAPAVLVDLSGRPSPEHLRRLGQVLGTAPVILIGVADHPTEDASTLAMDVLLCGSDDAPAPWVACGGSLEEFVEALVTPITSSPDASIALAQLLRVSSAATPAEAVVAESWVYSLLQSGPVHRRWLDSRASRAPRPRPDHPVVVLDRNVDVLTITLDRPEVHNAFGARMRDELVEAFRLVDVDRSISRVVLRGNGPSFCSGGDLDEFGTAPAPVEAHGIRTRRNAGIALAAVADRVEVHVHGRCVGAGVELPAFASHVIADPATTFLLPEVSMGLIPGAGGTSSIPRRIGRHRAAFFALSGRHVDARTALAWGLIDSLATAGRTEHRDHG